GVCGRGRRPGRSAAPARLGRPGPRTAPGDARAGARAGRAPLRARRTRPLAGRRRGPWASARARARSPGRRPGRPASMNTISFLSIPAGIVPEQEAVVCEGTRFSYAETLSRTRRLSGALAHLGVGCGTRVAALGVNSHRSVEAYYATALLGGVFIPLNYRAK